MGQYGYSRDHRPDCKQGYFALVVTREGFPLGYKVFPGKTQDATMVAQIVTTIEGRSGAAHRIWVMDRGMASQVALRFLRAGGRQSVVGTHKTLLRQLAPALTADGGTTVRPGIEVKQCPSPEPGEVFVLCRSQDRRVKERAMHARFGQRIEAGLARLGPRLGHARRPLDRGRLEWQMGRILAQNSRAAAGTSSRLCRMGPPRRACGLVWTVPPEWDDWAGWGEGSSGGLCRVWARTASTSGRAWGASAVRFVTGRNRPR